jgi:hypothetical protein
MGRPKGRSSPLRGVVSYFVWLQILGQKSALREAESIAAGDNNMV